MIRLARLTAPGAAKLARDPRVVVFLPLGAIEQHGPHLPLLVDWRGAEECNFRGLGPGGAGYFGWPGAARARTGRAAMALRGELIARRLLRALGGRSRS